jgi:Tfp pilus assembly protein PilP
MKNFLLMTIAVLGFTQLVMSVTMYVRNAPLNESTQVANEIIDQPPLHVQSATEESRQASRSATGGGVEPKKLSPEQDERARLDMSGQKRDPFVPYYSLNKSEAPNPNAPLTAFDLTDLRVAAIIKDSAGSYTASIETKSGKNFIVKRGIQIGTRGGQIVEIAPSKVIVSEVLKDNAGKRRVQFYEMALRSTKPPEGMTAPE